MEGVIRASRRRRPNLSVQYSSWRGVFGLLASPYGPKEGERFSKYASPISLFLSGYALAKIDPLLDKALSVAIFWGDKSG